MKSSLVTIAVAFLLVFASSARAEDGRRTVPMTPVTMTSTPWSSGTYTYDGAGNITAVGNDSFSYDLVSRLTSATVKGNTQAYTYDPFGNRLSGGTMSHGCSGGMDCAMIVTVNAATNRLATDTIGGTSENVNYDTMGNVTYLAGTTFTYDALGSMVTRNDGGGPFYVYDANDERIGAHTSTQWQWTVRDTGGQVLREYTASTASGTTKWTSNSWIWTRDHVYAGDKMLASVAQLGSSTVTEHFHLDHLGTPRLITVNGTEVAFKTYYSFGAELASAPIESPEETHKFTGHEFDDVRNGRFATDYMHARYYNATAGRFLSIDPETHTSDAMHMPQIWNQYAYARNNPVRMKDPNGRDGVDGVFMSPLAYSADERFMKSDQSGEGAGYGLAGAAVIGALIVGIEYAIDVANAPSADETAPPTQNRSLDNPTSWSGADPQDLRKAIPQEWGPPTPTKKDGGERYFNPAKRGEGIRIMPGDAQKAHSPDHAGPYAKFTKDGKIILVPLKGNPALPPPPPTQAPSLWKRIKDFF